jgi:hypothetical protein
VTELQLYSQPVHTVFDLLGDKEDDITYSLGWALAQSDELVSAFLREVFGPKHGRPSVILLQESIPGAGRTDIEITTDRTHLILEAKRGWDLPWQGQLEQYVQRFAKDKALRPALAVVAECSPAWAARHLPSDVDGVPVHYLPWSSIADVVERTAALTRSTNRKRLLRELVRYLKGVMTMQNATSNLVYVVALGVDPLVPNGPSFAEIVTQHNRYFHPLARTWPKTPPNYLGFRFWGQLQEIRHVESYSIEDTPWDDIPGLKGKMRHWEGEPHLYYQLGSAIKPLHAVRTGGLYGPGHHWAAIDLLLTSQTIREARDKTQQRLTDSGEL